uniref:Retrotransposon gag domain-containing protein n=1 Tax=Globodera rostochiensis TaxID=31243 RepID=A0A914HEY1_GLORO
MDQSSEDRRSDELITERGLYTERHKEGDALHPPPPRPITTYSSKLDNNNPANTTTLIFQQTTTTTLIFQSLRRRLNSTKWDETRGKTEEKLYEVRDENEREDGRSEEKLYEVRRKREGRRKKSSTKGTGRTERTLKRTQKELRKMDIDQLRARIAALERELQTSNSSRGSPLPTLYDGSEDFQQCPKAVYDGLSKAEKTNWMSLVDALADKLKRVFSSVTARQKLARRKQRSGESFEEFAQAVSELVSRAYPDHCLEMNLASLNLGAHENDVKRENENRLKLFRSGVARDFFRANMLPQLKEKALYMEEPTTLEEALTQAKRIEQVQSLMEDIWKQPHETKAEITISVVNLRTKWNELHGLLANANRMHRDEDCQRDWEEDCQTGLGQRDGEEDCQRDWEENCYHDGEECERDGEEDCERDGEEDCQYDWDENCQHDWDENCERDGEKDCHHDWEED